MRIGVFDSGLGGLTVLSELLKVSSGIDFFYLGDTARVPYGIRSTQTVINYARECALFLQKFEIDLLVIACNTVSAKATDNLRELFPHLEICEVITPAVEEVLNRNPKVVGVIGTPATIESKLYKKLLKKRYRNLKVLQKATPLLVPLVEEGLTEGPIAEEVLKHYLENWKNNIDTLLLGCTHYPLLEETIKKLYPHWDIINSAKPLAKALERKLKQGGINRINLFFSDKNAFLEKMLEKIPLKGEIEKIEFFSWEKEEIT